MYNIEPLGLGVKLLLQLSIIINVLRFASGIDMNLEPQQMLDTLNPWLNLILKVRYSIQYNGCAYGRVFCALALIYCLHVRLH